MLFQQDNAICHQFPPEVIVGAYWRFPATGMASTLYKYPILVMLVTFYHDM